MPGVDAELPGDCRLRLSGIHTPANLFRCRRGKPRGLRSPHVLGLGHHLEVIRANAGRVVAEVVQNETNWDRPASRLICPAVGVLGAARRVKGPITVVVRRAEPYPAFPRPVDLGPEAIRGEPVGTPARQAAASVAIRLCPRDWIPAPQAVQTAARCVGLLMRSPPRPATQGPDPPEPPETPPAGDCGLLRHGDRDHRSGSVSDVPPGFNYAARGDSFAAAPASRRWYPAGPPSPAASRRLLSGDSPEEGSCSRRSGVLLAAAPAVRPAPTRSYVGPWVVIAHRAGASVIRRVGRPCSVRAPGYRRSFHTTPCLAPPAGGSRRCEPAKPV